MKTKRSAFTLVEVLIVVVIMAILAAAIIPQFSDSTQDAKLSTAEFNWHTLMSQIELYKSQHDGLVPAKLENLTKKTDVDGTVNESTGKYGPYISELPANPWTGQNGVTEAADQTAPIANSANDGWHYNFSTGELWLAGKGTGGVFKAIGAD